MKPKAPIIALSAALVLCALALAATTGHAGGRYWSLPDDVEPYEYGNVVMDRASTANNVKPVVFSHWEHRLKYSCRVCHFELEFAFKRGETGVTEADNRNGLYCGACHNGSTAFSHTKPNCERCHSGDKGFNKEKFEKARMRLPSSQWGNHIDWSRALQRMSLEYSIFKTERPMRFDKELQLEAELARIPPARFPHKTHVQVLDCSNCHPDLFNIKKKTSVHLSMDEILKGQSCGYCHMTVAFPMNDCHGCHPGIKEE